MCFAPRLSLSALNPPAKFQECLHHVTPQREWRWPLPATNGMSKFAAPSFLMRAGVEIGMIVKKNRSY